MEPTFEHRFSRAGLLSVSSVAVEPGDDTHFWLIAEREVLTEVAMESAASSQLTETIQAGKGRSRRPY